MKSSFVFDDALFTYALCSEEMSRFSCHKRMEKSGLVVNHTSKTDVFYTQDGESEIAVIGLCVDARGELERVDIPGWILSQKGASMEDCYRACDRFAGKYVIFLFNGKGGFLWGDAVCNVQINYGFQGERFCAACVDKIAADYLGLRVSEYAKRIRLASELSQPMPGDLTMYDEIKSLLPNHYLDLSAETAVRVPLRLPAFQDIEAVAARSAELIHATTREYLRYYSLVCPLTSGYDSRLVFSFVKAHCPDVPCYTFRHFHFTDQSDDLVVPAAIVEKIRQPYQVIPETLVPDEYWQDISEVVGAYHARSTVALGYTYLSVFEGKAIATGDIIDQIGKSLLGNAVPYYLASPSFLQCKTHNVNPEVRKVIRAWMEEVRSGGEEEKNLFDLFAMENRCGRWVSQGSMLYALMGIPGLNIFNCRELIQNWICAPRALRAKKKLHKSLFLLNDPSLLDFPFNPSNKATNAAKSAWPAFYLASYAKQFLLTLKSHKRRR